MSEKRYGLLNPTTGEFNTFCGKVIYHSSPCSDARAEMEFLFFRKKDGNPYPIAEVPGDIPFTDLYPVRLLPGYESVRWDPLHREDFL